MVTQGDAGDLYFVIEDGTADVVADGRTVRRLGPGDGFGEIALLRDVPRTATVSTTSPCTLVVLERDPFIAAITGTTPAHQAVSEAVDRHLDTDSRREDPEA